MSSKSIQHEPLDSAQSVELERGRLNSLINSMGDGVIALDKKLNVIITNGAALNILDVNSPLIGKKIESALFLLDNDDHPLNVHKLIRETKTHSSSREWKLKLSDGEIVNLYTSIAPVQPGYGKEEMDGYVLILRDITREKSLEDERDEFISVVSHELRTPMTIAEGNVSNALYIFKNSGVVNESVQAALNETHKQILYLSDMMNDLAMLSRAERGKLSAKPESINAHVLVEELASSYKPEIESKGLKLKTEIDPKLQVLKSSRLYVKEILQNFITNSIKYTKKGSVTIGAKQKSDAGINFYITDTGIGITKSDQAKLFHKFFRSEDYRTRETSGTGLGLYITLKLSKLVNAKIDVDSHLNKGSTFTVFIPNLDEE